MKKTPAKTSVRTSNLPSALTTVTPFSKMLAMGLFILLPFAGFILGMKYQRSIDTEPEIRVCRRFDEAMDKLDQMHGDKMDKVGAPEATSKPMQPMKY